MVFRLTVQQPALAGASAERAAHRHLLSSTKAPAGPRVSKTQTQVSYQLSSSSSASHHFPFPSFLFSFPSLSLSLSTSFLTVNISSSSHSLLLLPAVVILRSLARSRLSHLLIKPHQPPNLPLHLLLPHLLFPLLLIFSFLGLLSPICPSLVK